MKFNKIISSLLVFVMLFTGIFTVLPVGSLAATATTVSVNTEAELKNEDVKLIIDAYAEYNYSTAEEMLEAELALGYLDSLTKGDYKVYLNRYTGLIYYVNGKTGQILTSNPSDVGYRKNLGYSLPSLLSQVDIVYMDLATNATGNYNTIDWIINGFQMTVSAMTDGIRVTYQLGETDNRFYTPGSIMAEDFEAHISDSLFASFADLVDDYCNTTSFNKNKSGLRDNNGQYNIKKVTNYVNSVVGEAYLELGDGVKYTAIREFGDAIRTLFNSYEIIDLSKIPESQVERIEEIKKTVPGCVNGPVYKLKDIESVATLRICHRAIRKYCDSYTEEMVTADEERAGYSPDEIITPNFKVVVEYTLDDKGNLVVTVPTSAIEFDAKAYTISELNVLKFFGAGDMNNDGYIFFPDGSGAVVEFEDFYTPDDIRGENVINPQIYLKSPIYGKDYCYASITGAYREQVVMPVYGIVNTVNSNAATAAITGNDKTNNGFFAIIEEGSALSSLAISTGGSTNKYATTYASFSPYPMDKYKVTGGTSNGYYYVVSENPYQGSLVTRYTMLTDTATADAADLSEYFDASYVGMAKCYREYLKDEDVIDLLSEVSEDLPLYIEALGSMDILQKILSFPVTVSVPLTTFEDVYTMYEELSNAKKTLEDKADEYEALADATDDDESDLKKQYKAKAEKYKELAKTVKEKITNINFRLTGFANGGMYFTYPTRVNWENSVGGRNGFEALIGKAETDSFGVYPDFDFAYINNTEIFDGITEKGTAACMVDNRYASKQVYNSVAGKYESLFALVVSSDSYDRLYDGFNSQYSGYSWPQLSVSTLGSDLNSNFDKKNSVDRESALGDVVSVLDKMVNNSNYKLMMDVGNVYAVKYAEHILNATLDSSHFRYSSYAVPFYGLVFHGYLNYAGSPINYSGDPNYDILRAIENGASLYYVLCMQNTNYLKDDENLSKYYGVDYKNWFDKLVVQYTTLNSLIGDLQAYEIVDHKSILSERVIDAIESGRNYDNLISELISAIDTAVYNAISAKQDEMRDAAVNDPTYIGKGVKFEVTAATRAELIEYAKDAINIDSADVEAQFAEALDELIEEYSAEFSGEGYAAPEVVTVDSSDVSYESIYNYFTDSLATSGDDYLRTDFTCDNGNVVMVTYRHPTTGDEVVFLLNYNAFAVDIIIDNTVDPTIEAGKTEKITLTPYGYHRI